MYNILTILIIGITLFEIYSYFRNKILNTYSNQLDTFFELGFELNHGIKHKDLLRWEGDKKAFEKKPWSLMLITLGQTLERDPWTPLTNKCWNFAPESIEGPGSYADIIINIDRISGPELNFTDIKDFVDIESGTAWVSFRENAVDYKWDLIIDNDWVDMSLFQKVQSLTKDTKSIGQFYWYDTKGQDFVIGCYSSEEVKIIKKKTGLNFQKFPEQN